MPRPSYRANELTTKPHVSKRKASFDVTAELLQGLHRPPIRADLAKAAQNTKNFMTGISFMNDTSRNNNMANVNTSSNFKSTSSSTINPSSNNVQFVNGIDSKALHHSTPLPTINENVGRNGNVLMNRTGLNSDGFPDTVDVGTTINSRTKPSSYVDTNKVLQRRNVSDVNHRNTNKNPLDANEGEYPTIGKGKRSQSQQIIATPHQPCCECLGCSDGGGTMGDVFGLVVARGPTDRSAQQCAIR